MPTDWTVDKINSLAPDAASASAAKKLIKPSIWPSLGYDGEFIWGECQGSGKDPYRTQIDIREQPAFKCSCPSQKFPCKHSLALFLLLASQEKVFTQKEAPDWVKEWKEKRAKQAEQKAKREEAKASNEAKPVDTEKQAKRANEREIKAQAGVKELELWLKDLMRQGLASTQSQNYSFWDKIAARMVDAQIPGIARMLREMASIPISGDGWQERLLDRLSRVYLLIEGYKRLESLPPNNQQDIRSFMGWTQKQEELLNQTGEQDNWLVLGETIETDPLNYNLVIQRIWLQSQKSNKFALILNFSFGNNQSLDKSLEIGTLLPAELVFFPSAYPLRAIIKNRQKAINPTNFPCYANILEFFDEYSNSLAKIPWLERLPIFLKDVQISFDENNWFLVDKENYQLKLGQVSHLSYWYILALSGGQPITLFGEWYLDEVFPLSIFVNNEFHSLDAASLRGLL
jgi:hypothetical protein